MGIEVGPIEEGEIKILKFNGATEMEEHVTIVSVARSIQVLRGEDASPLDRLIGMPVVSGQLVLQRFKPDLTGNRYKVKMLVTDSDGLVHSLVANLTVEC